MGTHHAGTSDDKKVENAIRVILFERGRMKCNLRLGEKNILISSYNHLLLYGQEAELIDTRRSSTLIIGECLCGDIIFYLCIAM